MTAYILRTIAWRGVNPDAYLAYQIVLSVNFLLTTICVLPFLAILQKFGVLVVTMESMVTFPAPS